MAIYKHDSVTTCARLMASAKMQTGIKEIKGLTIISKSEFLNTLALSVAHIVMKNVSVAVF
jgi:hypothetical protein